MGEKNQLYKLVVHYKDDIFVLKDICSKNYKFGDFCFDISDVASSMYEDLRDTPLSFAYDLVSATGTVLQRVPIKNDDDVIQMFDDCEDEVNLYVNKVYEDHIENGADENHIEEGGSDCSLNASTENESEKELLSELERQEAEDDERDESDMSGYESDNHCESENDSDSEIETYPLAKWSTVGEYEKPVNRSEDINLKKGMMFADVYEFREALKEYAIRKGVKIIRKKNEKARVTAHCAMKEEGCNWRIHASPMADNMTYQIKSYNPLHTCTREDKLKEADSSWLANQMVPILRAHPTMNTKGLREELKKFGVQPEYMQLYRARRKALEMIEGKHSNSYRLLPAYAELVRQKNPASVVKFQFFLADDIIPVEPSLKRVFLGFNALKNGFLEGCQPFLGLDGCHLKGQYGGILLSAVGIDGNNGLYPVAFAVVESENKENWCFFLNCLEQMLGGFSDNKPWTFMSDRQKGLIEAISECVPHAINMRCCRHIYANLRLTYPGVMVKKLFWAAARAYTAEGFNKAMNRLRKVKVGAFEYLMQIDSSLWARHAFRLELKNEHITNNISESFNSWISELRGKPIVTLLDGLRSKIMNRIHSRYQKGKKWNGLVCRRILKKLNDIKEDALMCDILVSSYSEFQINEGSNHYVVKLGERSCDCREWNLTGIPCKHAAAAIMYNRLDIEKFTHPAYYKMKFLKGYSYKIHAIPDSSFWPEIQTNPQVILPPPFRRKPGRPKKHRNREQGEAPRSVPSNKRSKVKCSICGVKGHNKRWHNKRSGENSSKTSNRGKKKRTD